MTTTLIRRPFRPSVLAPTDFLGDFDRLIAGFFRPISTLATDSASDWQPTVDLRETEEEFILEAELPGMSREDIELTLEEGVLTLSGERKLKSDNDGKGLHRLERRFGSFSRSFSLPRDIAGDRVKASFDNGLLRVAVPKKEQRKPRSIKIS